MERATRFDFRLQSAQPCFVFAEVGLSLAQGFLILQQATPLFSESRGPFLGGRTCEFQRRRRWREGDGRVHGDGCCCGHHSSFVRPLLRVTRAFTRGLPVNHADRQIAENFYVRKITSSRLNIFTASPSAIAA